MLQLVLTLVIYLILVIPVGRYLYHIAAGKHTFADPVFDRIDGLIYKAGGVDPHRGMNWRQYALALLGANAGIGISLGDNCTVEAGLYITAGTKITIWDKAKAAAGEPLEVVKGAELSGKDNILFIRNSVNGRIEARYRKVGIELNAKLHKN